MGKLLFVLIFVLINSLFIFGQLEKKDCPKINLSVPNDSSYMGREQKYHLAVSVEDYDWEKLKYEWNLSEKIPFEGQGKSVIFFIARENFDGLKVKATVKIEGLPEKCENIATNTFKIQFNPGAPIELENFEKLSFSKEKIRLDNVVSRMNEYGAENSIALFIIHYDKKETKVTLRRRILRISNYLIQKHKLSKGKFNFVISNSGEHQTKVYLVPKGKEFEAYDWEEDLRKIR